MLQRSQIHGHGLVLELGPFLFVGHGHTKVIRFDFFTAQPFKHFELQGIAEGQCPVPVVKAELQSPEPALYAGAVQIADLQAVKLGDNNAQQPCRADALKHVPVEVLHGWLVSAFTALSLPAAAFYGEKLRVEIHHGLRGHLVDTAEANSCSSRPLSRFACIYSEFG